MKSFYTLLTSITLALLVARANAAPLGVSDLSISTGGISSLPRAFAAVLAKRDDASALTAALSDPAFTSVAGAADAIANSAGSTPTSSLP